MLRKADFLQSNGFSNEYRGRGHENEELRERCFLEEMTIVRRRGTYSAPKHESASRNKGKNGLSSLKYTVIESGVFQIDGNQFDNVFFHEVEI